MSPRRLFALLRYLPREGAFWSSIVQAEPETFEPPKKQRRAATADEVASMFGLRRNGG